MGTVLVFGTFDLLHAGHRWLLGQARQHGDPLVVSLARDQFVRTWKAKQPRYPQAERMRRLLESGLVDQVRLSDARPNSFALLVEVRPDLICLGHDQRELGRALRLWMRREGVRIPVKRIGRMPATP